MTAPSAAALRRRRVIAGVGVTVATAARVLRAASAAAAPAARWTGRDPPDSGLPVLRPSHDWERVLAVTPQVQLEPGATYTLSASVKLPDGCLIVGNGATVTVAHASLGAFTITEKDNVRITGVVLLGQKRDPINTAAVFGHVGVSITRSTDVRIDNCDFAYWSGAGIVETGSTDDDYFDYRCKIQANTFYHCYFGISIADRGEYGILSGNSFHTCRLAIWDSAGNWAIVGNSIVRCYGAYYSIADISPYGKLSSDNWSHGSLVGNTFNHCCSIGAAGHWSGSAAFNIGGTVTDPGPGLVVGGVLPPTFSGNTLWYSNITGVNMLGTRWLLSGSTFSNLQISCTGSVPIQLVGTQANGPANLPTLVGNVQDLLPGPASS